jgi:large subunit ribosomal protein L6
MSRIGKKPILIPEGVEVKIEGREVKIKGPKGELARTFPFEVKIEIKENQIFVSLSKETSDKRIRAYWGTARAEIFNMVSGVVSGFEKKLQIEGIGYKAIVLADGGIELFVGFSHTIKIEAPAGIKYLVEKNIITISGIDKEMVGQMAAIIRKKKKPEPYKGKGIRYVGEIVRKKVGKKAVASAG